MTKDIATPSIGKSNSSHRLCLVTEWCTFQLELGGGRQVGPKLASSDTRAPRLAGERLAMDETGRLV